MKNPSKKSTQKETSIKHSTTPKMTYEEALKKANKLEKQGLVLSSKTQKEIVKAISENLSAN